MVKVISLSKQVNENFYNSLVKCNFLESLTKMLTVSSAINISWEDIINVSDSEVVGSIVQNINDLNDELNINYICDKKPNVCLLYIYCGINVNLTDINYLVDKLRNEFDDISVILGIGYSKKPIAAIELHALLLYSEEEIMKDDMAIEQKKAFLNDSGFNKHEKSANDLAYEIAIYCKNNTVTLDNLLEVFNLHYIRTRLILERLQRIEILCFQDIDKPIRMITTNEEEIKKRIYTFK